MIPVYVYFSLKHIDFDSIELSKLAFVARQNVGDEGTIGLHAIDLVF